MPNPAVKVPFLTEKFQPSEIVMPEMFWVTRLTAIWEAVRPVVPGVQEEPLKANVTPWLVQETSVIKSCKVWAVEQRGVADTRAALAIRTTVNSNSLFI